MSRYCAKHIFNWFLGRSDFCLVPVQRGRLELSVVSYGVPCYMLFCIRVKALAHINVVLLKCSELCESLGVLTDAQAKALDLYPVPPPPPSPFDRILLLVDQVDTYTRSPLSSRHSARLDHPPLPPSHAYTSLCPPRSRVRRSAILGWHMHEPVVRQAAADRLRKRRRGGELRAYLGRRTHGTPFCKVCVCVCVMRAKRGSFEIFCPKQQNSSNQTKVQKVSFCLK